MCKKSLGVLLMGAMAFFCSCVDDTYDLANKELAMDVKIEGNRLALPLGSLRAIMLDSLISVEELDMVDKMDGVFSINIADTIAPYEYPLPEIKFAIPAKKTNVAVSDFAHADITEVDIKGQSPKGTKFDVPDISLDDLKIPKLETNATQSAANDQVREIINSLGNVSGNQYFDQVRNVDVKHTVTLENKEVKFELNYVLPKEIKSISSILLKADGTDADSDKGALIGFEIIHPTAMAGLKKNVEFDIEFPKEFRLSKAPTTMGTYTLSEDRHHLSVKNLVVEPNAGTNTVVEFYIEKLEGLDEKIKDGQLVLDEAVVYSVVYTVEGSLELSTNTKLEDFDFKVNADLGLAFRDVVGETNDIEVKFAPVEMAFDIDFDDLQYIDKIEYIEFDAQKSSLHFHAEMKGGFAPFALKDGYALKLEFPEELIINEALSDYPRKNIKGETAVEYVANEHAFYIYDVEVFNSDVEDVDSNGNPIYGHWNLAFDRFNLHEEVVDGKFHHDVEAKVTVVNNRETIDKLVFAGTALESLSATLESLKSKEVSFRIWDSHFSIDDAVVHTEVIKSPLEHHVEFEFDNNDLPKEIRRVESIGFDGDVPVFFKLNINGLEDLDTHITLDLHVKLPSALKLATKAGNNDIEIVGDSLIMRLPINPSSKEPTLVELVCQGLDFTKGVDGNVEGIRPSLKNDKGYILYKSDIAVVGNVVVEGSDFHADVLDKDISVDVDFELGDVRVKDFHGIFYIDDLGTVEESFELNLGEGLEFLKDESNSLVLSDPQIMLEVENSISIPVGAKLSLIGKDQYGNAISTSVIEHDIRINPASYDAQTNTVTPSSTKLFLTSKPSKKDGYENVCLENLSNLLKQVPSSIDISLIPIIDTTQTQHINLIQPLSFGGNYSVVIPLQFDELNFTYSDTIANLQADMGEMMEMFSNVEVGLGMNIKNSLPLQLQLKAIPLDKDGKTIRDIEISSFEIPAGDGKAFTDTIKGKKVDFSIKSKTGDISSLDMLKFEVHAAANSTEGGAPLRGDQGLKLDDIVITVAGDIEMDLNENSNK